MNNQEDNHAKKKLKQTQHKINDESHFSGTVTVLVLYFNTNIWRLYDMLRHLLRFF